MANSDNTNNPSPIKASAISTEFFESQPENFNCTISASICWLHFQNQYLLLKRAPNMPQPLTWGGPAGKIDQGETPIDTAVRETYEETSITLDYLSLVNVGKLYARQSHGDHIFHLFSYQFPNKPAVKLSNEHNDYKWVSLDEARTLPLLSGGKVLIEFYEKNLLKSR